VELAVKNVVMIGMPDTNAIVIHGRGEITSFGPSPVSIIDGAGVCCTKTVMFHPEAGGITLVNGTALALLCARDRVILSSAFGSYVCDEYGVWMENGFWETGEHDTSRRLEALEKRLFSLEERLRLKAVR
jgi:hypothetical protein